jgi:hypothetical protein
LILCYFSLPENRTLLKHVRRARQPFMQNRHHREKHLRWNLGVKHNKVFEGHSFLVPKNQRNKVVDLSLNFDSVFRPFKSGYASFIVCVTCIRTILVWICWLCLWWSRTIATSCFLWEGFDEQGLFFIEWDVAENKFDVVWRNLAVAVEIENFEHKPHFLIQIGTVHLWKEAYKVFLLNAALLDFGTEKKCVETIAENSWQLQEFI